MRELVNETIREGFADKEPEGGYTKIWVDQAPLRSYFADRFFFASYTPFGVHAVYVAFLRRMRSAEPGDSKRSIKRDIQSNPHLHFKLKAQLLKRLKKASVRDRGRGLGTLTGSSVGVFRT